jgi:hypothetical protein
MASGSGKRAAGLIDKPRLAFRGAFSLFAYAGSGYFVAE